MKKLLFAYPHKNLASPAICFVRAVGIVFLLAGTLLGAAKKIVIIADYGMRPPTPAVVDMLLKTPALKISIAWPASVVPSAKMLELVRRGQVAPLMTIVDEPLLAVIDQSDARDIVARTREWFEGYFPASDAGMYVRSGAYSEALISSLARWGAGDIVMGNIPAAAQGQGFAARVGENNVLLTGTGAFATTDECWQHVESSTAGVAVITLRDAAMLTPAFFASLNEKLQLDPSVNATLPSDPLLPTSGGIPPGWLMTEDEIRGAFPPTLRDKVFDARSAIEEYKNSGEAVVEKIKMARGELYHAYSFAFIRQVQDGTDPNAELAFTAGLRNMYRLIGKPFPVESSVIRASLAPVPSGSSLSIECSSTSLIFRGIARDTTTLSIESLSVILDSAVVSYRVNLSTSAWASAPVIDIYIDMNNQRGAGLTNLLPGPAAFLVEENGWELAIRMDRYQIALYRAGRGGPVLMKTFRVGRPYQVDIPRTVFRGNPLAWWYQAVVMVRGSVGEPWNILDFLSPTSTQKQRIFAKPPLQLPAIQYQNPQ